MDIGKDVEFARVNCERLIASFPQKIARQEAAVHRRLHDAKISPLKKLAAIYELVDTISEHIHKSTPCKKGCSGCCHYTVSISEIEIQYIESKGKLKRRKVILPKGDFHGTACPLLKNNECSIYDVRPYVCRRHHSLAPDSRWCAPDAAFDEHFSRLEFSDLERAFGEVRAGSPALDIRQVFG